MISSLRLRSSGRSVAFALFATATAFCQQDFAPAISPGDFSQAAAEHASLPEQNSGVDLGRVSLGLALDDLQIVLKRSPEQQQALDIVLVRQNQQGDPLFHAWLSPAEFGETFGVSAQDLASIREWLQGQGFSVGSVRADEMVINFSGTIAQIERAFKVEIHRYRATDGSVHMAAATEQKIPQQLSKSVLGFTGLNGSARVADCASIPEAVQQALQRNVNQLNAAQGYPNSDACQRLQPPQTIHDNVSGAVTLLASFTGLTGNTLGGSPYFVNLIQANDGNFYGTSSAGGTIGYGVVFKITSAGTYTVMHSFAGTTTDGGTPYAGLIQGTDGNFYGTTKTGGANGLGTVFKISATSPYAVTLLHSFSTSVTDGQNPYGALVQGTDGNFYGTTYAGGSTGYGVAFKILAASPYTFTVMHYFSGVTTDGQHPSGTLVQGTDGNFYGTARAGGANGFGIVFKLAGTSPYTMTLMHSFPAPPRMAKIRTAA